MKDLDVNKYSNDDEYESAKRNKHKHLKQLRKLKKGVRSVNVKRLNESKCGLWKDTFEKCGY